jgi:hypothetical protein
VDWKPYGPCCSKYAADPQVGFCPDCGHPYLRCLAFAECRSLVTPTDACPTCVAPVLMIDAGAVVESKTGERLSVPVILRNGSPGNRPLFVKRIVKWNGQVEEPLALTWEQIEAGAERRFTVDTPPMAEGGTHTLGVILVLASRYKGLEEEYAFTAGMSVSVSGPESKQIVQNINLSGAQFQTGGMVHTTMNTETESPATREALKDRTLLSLSRADKYEIQHGIRGYREDALRVPRHVEFAFRGFKAGERPEDGTTSLLRGRLVCGRNSRTGDPAQGDVVTDVSLRAYDSRGAKLDEPGTMAISRRHFDLVVVNDRLCLQAWATRGMQVNGEDLTSGQVVVLEPGDKIVPIPGRADKMTLQVAFTRSLGTVDRVTLSRTPALAS